LEAIWISTGLVALAEIGDKTQLLAIVLAARFRKPVPIVLGILAATVANHALAAGFGYLIAQWLTGQAFQIGVAVAFIAMAAWTLVPDKADDEAAERGAGGVFLTTLVAFFIVEIGDKTQIATSLLAARFNARHDARQRARGAVRRGDHEGGAAPCRPPDRRPDLPRPRPLDPDRRPLTAAAGIG